MNISVIGSGYVGLVTAACLAETGHDVRCMDTDEARIDSLRAGFCPIYEPKLPELLERNAREGRLHFSASLAETLDGADAAFIAVGTPEGEDGSADIRYVCNAAHSVGRLMTGDLVVVVKSTVPVGYLESLRTRYPQLPNLLFSPEFLPERSLRKQTGISGDVLPEAQ